MSGSAALYVKSEKVDQVHWTMPHRDHWCSAGYRASNSELVLGDEDRMAIQLLEKAGLHFSLVDLGLAGAVTRVRARMDGTSTTPTLIYKGQRFKGLQQIMKILETIPSTSQK